MKALRCIYAFNSEDSTLLFYAGTGIQFATIMN